MPGTSVGGRKSAATNKQRDPDHYLKIGHKGGKATVAKGFSMASPEQRSEAGRKGGQTARKSKKSP
jgi:general stress protein YciG